MRNKKGFTLVELLAVIVIIGVIGTIVSFSVYQIMETIRKNAFESSVRSIFEATDLYKKSKDMEVLDRTYDIKSDSGLLTIDKNTFNTESDAPEGLIHDYGNEIYVENITDGNYCATGSDKNLVITRGACDTILNVRIESINQTYDSQLKVFNLSITANSTMNNETTKKVEYYFYISEDNLNWSDAVGPLGGNAHEFKGITPNKDYYFKVDVKEISTGNIVTSEVVKHNIEDNNIEPIIVFSSDEEELKEGYNYYQKLTRKFTIIDNSGIQDGGITYCLSTSGPCDPKTVIEGTKKEHSVEFKDSPLPQFLCVEVIDANGLSSGVVCDKVKFRVDGSNPTSVNIANSLYDSLENKIYTGAVGQDVHSGIHHYEYSINGGAWSTANIYDAPAGRVYEIQAKAINNSGLDLITNEADSIEYHSKVLVGPFETVASKTTKISGYTYYQRLTRQIELSHEGGIKDVKYCLSSTGECTPTNSYLKTEGVTDVIVQVEYLTNKNAQYLCIEAINTQDETTGVICDIGFLVDSTPAYNIKNNNSSYSSANNKIYLSATATDVESGIKKIEYQINEGAWTTTTIHDAPAGNKYNIRVRVTNGAGIVSYSNENLITLSTKPKINTPTYYNIKKLSDFEYYQRINTHTNAISQIPLREVKYCRTTGSTCTPNLWASITNSYSSYINVDYQTNAYATKICFQARNDVGWSDKVCSNSYKVDGTRPVNLSGDAWHSTTKNAAHISGTGYDYESGVKLIQYAATGVGYSGNYIVGVSCDIGTYEAYIRVINNSGLHTDMVVKYLPANVCCNLPAIGAGCTNPGEVVDCYGTIRTCSIQHSTGWWTPTAHSGGWFSQYQMEGGILQTGLCTGYPDPNPGDHSGYYVAGQVFNSGGLDANFNAYPMAYISGDMIYDHYSLSGPKNHHSAYCSYNTYYAWS